MRDTRQHDPVDVGDNFVQRLALFRRLGGQLRSDRAGLRLRRNAIARDIFAVIGNPIRDLVQMFAKLCRGDITELFTHAVIVSEANNLANYVRRRFERLRGPSLRCAAFGMTAHASGEPVAPDAFRQELVTEWITTAPDEPVKRGVGAE